MRQSILILALLLLYGCQTTDTLWKSADQVSYEQELSDIEDQYENGKITYSEYMKLKDDLRHNYQEESLKNK